MVDAPSVGLKRTKRVKPKSRAVRWSEAVAKAQEAKSDLEAAKDKLESAFADLNDLKSDYENWRDNLPENLQSSPLGEKLEAVCDLDFDVEIDLDGLDVIDEADGIDLPQGFGRD